jgi:hypothetical protein
MSIFAPKRHLCSNIGILALFDNFGLRISQKPKQILFGAKMLIFYWYINKEIRKLEFILWKRG